MTTPQLQIVLADKLTAGDRFARRDWIEGQDKRVIFSVTAPPQSEKKDNRL